MKKALLLAAFCTGLTTLTFSQVDTSLLYNPNTPYGNLDIRIAKSPARYYYLQEDVTFSFRESAPGVKTNTYRDMTSWDSSPYTEGNLREHVSDEVDNFVMNYRLLKPANYNSSFENGYPLVIMFHGSGEKANCWNTNCYHGTREYNPLVNDPPAPTDPNHELLNNDHSLLHGGRLYLDAVTKAGSKLPNDPSLPEGAFPGFVLFPQSLNGWNGSVSQEAIKIVRLLIKKYNIDENRIYVNGISNGGHGAYEAIKRAPWLFASAIMMSAVDDGFITTAGLESTTAHIPLWIFQGALDDRPYPSKTKTYVKRFRDAGAVVRYTEYPDIGHTTWNRAFKEPDFISWMLGINKGAIHVFSGSPTICGSTTMLELPAGFKAYQWQLNGQTIPNATSATYQAQTAGKYRARFSRTSENPGENDWNDWSPEVELTQETPPVAEISQIGTVLLKDLNNENNAVLQAIGDFAHYYWYKNGALLDLPGDQDDTTRTLTVIPVMGNGAYTLVTGTFSNCTSQSSAAKHLFFNDEAPLNITAPSGLTGANGSATSVTLNWNDNSTNEGGFEIWRRKKIGESYSPWQLAVLTAADVKSYQDSELEPSVLYQYKIRAVSNLGRSDYFPSGTQAVEVTSGADQTSPDAPLNLAVQRTGLEKAKLTWNASTDDSGIKEYLITHNGNTIRTASIDTVYFVTDLQIDSVYSFYVRAVDLAGNESDISNQVTLTTNVSGLFYEHSPGYWKSLDSINWSRPEYTGFVENFTLDPKIQEDYFYFRFDGFLHITTEGDYKFRISSDDGSRLYLNGSIAADNDGIHNLKSVESSVLNLTAGAHRITAEFFEYSNGDTLVVEYNGADTNNEWMPIPSSALKSNLVIGNEPAVERSFVLNVFPNPAPQHNLNIRLQSLMNFPVRIELVDPVGRVLHEEEVASEEARQGVKLSGEARLNGVYIIRVSQGNNVVQQKVIIGGQ